MVVRRECAAGPDPQCSGLGRAGRLSGRVLTAGWHQSWPRARGLRACGECRLTGTHRAHRGVSLMAWMPKLRQHTHGRHPRERRWEVGREKE